MNFSHFVSALRFTAIAAALCIPVSAQSSKPNVIGKPATDWRLDGVNLLPFLEDGKSGHPHNHLCWRFGPQWAIRQGDWKLAQGFDPVATPTPAPRANFYKVTPPQLFDLSADPGKTKDLAALQPQKVASLKALYDRWNAANRGPSWLPNPTMVAAKKK